MTTESTEYTLQVPLSEDELEFLIGYGEAVKDVFLKHSDLSKDTILEDNDLAIIAIKYMIFFKKEEE